MSERRVAVTGIGILCALGNSREESFAGMLAGRCGIRPITGFDTTGYRSRLGAEVDDADTPSRFTPLERRRLSRADRLAVLAASEALDDAGLLASGIHRGRVGVLLGSGTGDLVRNEEWLAEVMKSGVRHAPPSKIFGHFTSQPADVVATRFELTGLKASLLSACSSSTIAIGYAGDAIREGRLDAALAGGCDVLCRLTLAGFNALRLVATEPCRPFDVARTGLNIGEASAILVLEEMERAKRRGAPIYAELAGYAAVCEAYHPTAPEPDGRAMARLLRDTLAAARVDRDEVDHVNSHGTGTPQNDRAEARGLHAYFGERARRIPVNALKSMVGHCLSAAGAIEAAALALTIARGAIPPTIHHETTDPACDLDVVASVARDARVRCGVSTSLAFGGNDAALVMRAVE